MLLTHWSLIFLVFFLLFYARKSGRDFSDTGIAFMRTAQASVLGIAGLILIYKLEYGGPLNYTYLIGGGILSTFSFGVLAAWISSRENHRIFPLANPDVERPLLRSAFTFERKGDHASAIAAMEKLANLGNPFAQRWLSEKHETGDDGKGKRWRHQALAAGDPIILHGYIVERDNEESLFSSAPRRNLKRVAEAYHMAAELGDSQACKDLAEIYFHGLGTKSEKESGLGLLPDSEQAMAWLEKLAEQGDPGE